MKQIYIAPVLEIELFGTEDVLAISISSDRGSLEEIYWGDGAANEGSLNKFSWDALTSSKD